MDIGKKIRRLRLENNLSQIDLAHILGVSKSTMSNYERNYSTPDPETLVKLTTYFNVSIDYIFSGADTIAQYEALKETSSYNNGGSSLSKDEGKVIQYYRRLSEEHKDYIKGQMVHLLMQENSPKKELPGFEGTKTNPN